MGSICVAGGKHMQAATSLTDPEATHRLAQATDIRTIEPRLGHNSLQTTMIYAHVLQVTRNTTSPLSRL